MKYLKQFLTLSFQFMVAAAFAQISFSNATNLLTPSDHKSGVAIAIADMNGDGLDDIIRLNQGVNLNIQYQTAPNQAFSSRPIGILPGNGGSQWGMCVGDIDNNGFTDVLTGGSYDGVKIAKASADGTGFDIINYSNPGTFVQGVNFSDINNDGFLDAFVCHDDGTSRIFENNGDGTFTYQPMWINLATVPNSDNSGNYGSVWSDVNNDGYTDLYIAHCRQGVNSSTDPRRINQLFLNNGDGTYTQDIDDISGLRIGAQSWTADFGDIDNDGDFDCFITNHNVSSQLLENDGSGHFTDITATSGLFNAIGGTPIQGVFRDFDNDGFIDILVAGSVQYLFKNNGDKTYTEVANLFSNNDMESFAIGDLNGDGFQDIYAGYADIYTTPSNIPDALWMNDGNDNHFLGLTLVGSQSNKGGVGAKVHLYSALGIQTREVRSGESYGISNSLQIHFGMGQEEIIDSVVVQWPSGIRDVIINPALNQYLTLGEGGCLLPTIGLEALGNTTFCTGDSLNIVAPVGYLYSWNNGDSTQTSTIFSAGEYRVTVTDDEGCTAVSNTVLVTVDPIEIPQISIVGDTVFCQGSSVLLTSSAASAYQWNTGDSTQSITVTEPGQYYVTTQGLCAYFDAQAIGVEVLTSALPLVTPDTVSMDSSATLLATGDLLQWYATDTSSTVLFTGNPFVTAPITAPTTYWVSNTSIYDSPNEFVGMVDHEGSNFSDNNYIGGLVFDCFAPFTLAKVKVYTTVAEERKIDLTNSNGEVLASKVVYIPSGTTVIDLGMDIPVGTDLVLLTDAGFNQATIGSQGPQLRRSTQGINFPYVIPGVVSLKSSTFNETRYYYFFDWEVDFKGYACESERVPVTAELAIVSNSATPAWANELRLFPNPTSGALTVSCKQLGASKITISLKNMQGLTLQSEQLAAASEFQYQWNLSALPKGVYWVELASADGVVRKIVVLQ